MKYQFIDTYRSEFAVERMCRALKVSKSGYYAFRIRPQSKRTCKNEKLDHHIKNYLQKEQRHLWQSTDHQGTQQTEHCLQRKPGCQADAY